MNYKLDRFLIILMIIFYIPYYLLLIPPIIQYIITGKNWYNNTLDYAMSWGHF